MQEKFNLELFLAESVSKDKGSLFQQIYENLRQAILSDQLRRGFQLPSTRLLAKEGAEVVAKVSEVVLQNREKALEGIDQSKLRTLDKVLLKITENCSNGSK